MGTESVSVSRRAPASAPYLTPQLLLPRVSRRAGVVTPYSAQVKHITELAQSRVRVPPGSGDKPAADLEIQSVDAYQGR